MIIYGRVTSFVIWRAVKGICMYLHFLRDEETSRQIVQFAYLFCSLINSLI